MNAGKKQYRLPITILLSLVIGLQPLYLASYAAGDPRLVELNNEGVKALNSNNFQLAVQKFEAALKIDPNYAKAKENLAIAYNNYGLTMQSNPAEAIKYFHKALYLSPNNATTLANLDGIIGNLGKNPNSAKDRQALGDQARAAGDMEGAAVEYEAAGRLQPDPKVFSKLGDVYRVKGESERSIAAYQNAGRAGDSADVQVKLGQAFQAKKDLPSALAAYDKALRLKPDDPDVLDALVAGWEEALKLDPMSAANHIGLGQSLQYRGDFDQAAAEYQQALRFDKSNALAQRLLGELDSARRRSTLQKHINAGVDLQTRKLFDQALEEYRKALEMDPKNSNVYVNIGTVYQTREDYEKATDAYNKALAIDPNNIPAQQGLKAAQDEQQRKRQAADIKEALDLYTSGNYDAAIKKYEQLLRLNPKDPVSHFNLGAAYQAKKDIDQAIAEYKQAIMLDAKSDEYKKALEVALDLKAGPLEEAAEKKHTAKDYAGAIDLYNQALSIRPKNATWWFNLAGAHYAREDYSSAKEAYKKALELDPKGQADNGYLIAIIDEHNKQGALALAAYRKYAAEHPTGKYIDKAKERMKALSANIQDTIRIQSEHELAQIKEAEDAFQEAMRVQKENKYDEAMKLYQKAIGIQPKEAAYVYGMGTLYQQKNEIDQAISWYQKAADLDPKNANYKKVLEAAFDIKAQPLVDQAFEKFKANDYAGAIEAYRQALIIVPNKARIWTNFGAAYQASDDFRLAQDAYKKAVQLDAKGEVEDEFLIANISEHYGLGQEALNMYRKYVMDAPAGANASAARQRIQALTANLMDTQKLLTSREKGTLKEINDAFDQGLKLQQAGKYEEALPLYQKVVQLSPKDAGYAYNLGTLYQAMGNMDLAVEWYQKAVALDPKNNEYKMVLTTAIALRAEPLIKKAEEKHAAGDLAGAITLYKQGLDITPNDAHTWSNYAGALQGSDDFSGARAAYQKAVELNSKQEIESLFYLAALDEHFSQGAKALSEYQRYVAAAPNGPNAAAARERVRALSANINSVVKIPTSGERQKLDTATNAFQQAIQLQTDNKLDEALVKYKEALAVMPNEAPYWFSMGTCYQASGNLEEAANCYTKASQIDPKEKKYKDVITQLNVGKADTILQEAITKHSAGDLAGAIDLYNKSLAITPNNARSWSNLAGAYIGMDNFQQARSSYQKAVDLDAKGEAESWYFLGGLDEHFNQGAKAIQDYQKYMMFAPRGNYAAYAQDRIKALTANPNATQKQATASEKQKSSEAATAFDNAIKLQTDNKLDEAIEEYKKSLAIDSKNANVWFSLGTAYQAKGDIDAALDNYIRASELNPKDAQYKQLITGLKQSKADPLLKSGYEKQTTKDANGNYDLAGAIADYEAALKFSDDGATHFSLGTAYQGLNNLPKAVTEYKRAVQLDPKQVDAYYYLGSIYEALHQPALALAEYRKYLQFAPTGQNAADAKERVKALASAK